MKKIVIIASTEGSVISNAIKKNDLFSSVYMVVSDMPCGAIEFAEENGIRTCILESSDGYEFSDKLCDFFNNESIDYFISFYTRLFRGDFLSIYAEKIFNFHPSLLPACPGMDGFGDTIRSGSLYFGSTVHLVDGNIDTGKPVMQSVFPFQPDIDFDRNRHLLFVQQCKMFVQLITWLIENRYNQEYFDDVSYEFSEFVPNLEMNIKT